MSYTEWNEILKGRKIAGQNLPHLMSLPVVKSARELLPEVLKKGSSVLDIGANDRNLKRFLAKKGLDAEYLSLDADRTLKHDYHEFREIGRTFDAAAAFEVIEHMELPDAIECFRNVYTLLKNGGVFIVSTPNVCHPTVFWRDCTHITPFRYDELYGLLASTGFTDIKIYRCADLKVRDRLLSIYYRPLLRLMRMDFAPGIAAVARRA